MKNNKVWLGGCLELLPKISDKTVDLIIADLPYGVTQNCWDSVIPLKPLWEEYKRIIKDKGAIVLMAQNLFAQNLISTATVPFRYSLVWKKNKPRGFLNANRQPLRIHEDILVFYKKQPTYNPQKTTGHNPAHAVKNRTSSGSNYGETGNKTNYGGSTQRFPTSIIEIPVVNENQTVHPTEKPVELGEWIIKTYTNPGDLILDNTCGSGSFLVAAKKLNRNFLGVEKNIKHYKMTKQRLLNSNEDDRF